MCVNKSCREIVSNLKCTVQPRGYKQESESHELPGHSLHLEAREKACVLPTRHGGLQLTLFLCTMFNPET